MEELDTRIIDKVGQVIKSINEAKHVDQVICALHSLAVLLFPLDSRAFAGSIDKQYRDEVIGAEVPAEQERDKWWQVFYRGAAFPTLARLLLYDVALNWLACFPISAKKYVYDVFFLRGRVTEVVQTLVPCLQNNGNGRLDASVCTNVERLLALCLLENDGVLQLAREFGQSDSISEQPKPAISRMPQLVTSIPDKARLGASTSLSSHFFFKQVTVQLIRGAEELDRNMFDTTAVSCESDVDGNILFAGEVFARISRRGSADVLLSVLIPRVLTLVRGFILPETDMSINESFESKPGLRFWLKIVDAIKDPYAVERISEQLLHQLASLNASDVEAYWVLWILYHQIYERQTSVRSMFVERFLLWKVFPICCLRWILQFAVLECAPDTASTMKGKKGRGLLETAQRLLAVWSKREFVHSAPIEQQAYVTAAVGLSLEKMVKDDLDASKDAMQSILQGVSCRLESPSHLVRKMASCVALVFSQIIDPSNPLYLDDSCNEETIDWEFGLGTPVRGALATSQGNDKDIEKVKVCNTLPSGKEFNNKMTDQLGIKDENKKLVEFKLLDPDEVIDPVTLNNELGSNEDDNDDEASETSETSTDSSLQPYDLHDDDSDLKRNLSQLVDVVAALRKSDDADGVERALDVAEKLIRASPDELKFVAADLVRTLVQVRCSDSTLEGEEESAEEKRQKALIALIVTCPFDSLDPMNKLLYSPHVDVSQRIMILEVMTNAAHELANTRTRRENHSSRAQISITSETRPWFMPSSMGPPEAGTWKEISGTGSPLSLSYSYERDLPSKPSQIKRGMSRRWASKPSSIQDNQLEWSQNKFPLYAAAFMLPAMQGFDKKRHGVDLLGRDFIVLGKLIYMLGMCMKCAAMHPEASALALPLMDMLRSREICYHVEAYVRKSALFAASCILLALHPSYVASSLVDGNLEISRGLEWVRTWAIAVTESDSDKECYTMAMACLQLHSEMALQTSRVLESAEDKVQANSVSLPLNLLKGSIKIPYLNV